MGSLSRRSFLTAGSAAAAGVAGAAVVGFTVAGEPEFDAGELEELQASADLVLVQVLDPASGEVELLVREQSIVFTDRALVAKVLRASR